LSPPARTGARQLLSPELLTRLESLQLRARIAADGALTGLHKSPHHGASVEFAEHKEYAPGDEIRHIDWRVFAKSDKYYVKRFEQETNLDATILIDASASMRYRSPDAVGSKWDYAATTAASLAHLLLRQQDAVGMIIGSERVDVWVPPRSRYTHLMHLCELLVRNAPKPEASTNLLAGATHLLEVSRRRGLVFVISDFLDPDPHFFNVLKQLRSRRYQVFMLQILDPWELTFPFDDMTVFKSLESGREILAEPRVIREAYLKGMNEFVRDLRTRSLAARLEYRLLSTDEPLMGALTDFISGRPQERFARKVGAHGV
jgi:uncharacterized protein (DUF58 family)